MVLEINALGENEDKKALRQTLIYADTMKRSPWMVLREALFSCSSFFANFMDVARTRWFIF